MELWEKPSEIRHRDPQPAFSEQLCRAKRVCVVARAKLRRTLSALVLPLREVLSFSALHGGVLQLANSVFSLSRPLSSFENLNLALAQSGVAGEPDPPGPGTLRRLASASPPGILKMRLFSPRKIKKQAAAAFLCLRQGYDLRMFQPSRVCNAVTSSVWTEMSWAYEKGMED